MTDLPPLLPTREEMSYDVLIVGAGPAGLACAIRLKQLAPDLSVCVIEKGAEAGSHLLSGLVIEPRALDELLPDWRTLDAPLETKAAGDKFYFLTERRAVPLPLPPTMHNDGNYIGSLALLGRWLAAQAEGLGVEIYAGFAGAEVLYDDGGAVIGVATGDIGLSKDGSANDQTQRGMALLARQTIFAEGARGSLTKRLVERFNLRANSQPQTYSLGVKEVWEITPDRHRTGEITHTLGWPLDTKTYGGGWLYHFQQGAAKTLVSTGFVTALDYSNPYLDLFAEMQRFKTHELLRDTFAGGKRIGYGARAIASGGWQALPKLSFPGGLLIGDTAGFLNVPKIKGTHTAMKSGMVAAEAVVAHLAADRDREVADYRARLESTWLMPELHAVRNVKPAFKKGLYAGLIYAAVDQYLLRGRAPWTFKLRADFTTLQPAASSAKPDYKKPDGVLTFDKLSSVFLSGTNHAEGQPPHLRLRDPRLAITLNLAKYGSPESRYCPAQVYEIVGEGADSRLQINAQNCVHCKTCDIKDPAQNIDWQVPEGGGGPNYSLM